jgi:hypothetical protein
MTDYFYDSYLSPLDALAFDIVQSPSEIDQETAAADLALWVNVILNSQTISSSASY